MNHQNVLDGLEPFVESNNEDECFNDLLKLWDLFLNTRFTKQNVNADVMVNIAKTSSVKTMAKFFRILVKYRISIVESGKPANENHACYLVNYDMSIGQPFMDIIRGDRTGKGTEEERKIANDWIDGECKYLEFLKTRKANEFI